MASTKRKGSTKRNGFYQNKYLLLKAKICTLRNDFHWPKCPGLSIMASFKNNG